MKDGQGEEILLMQQTLTETEQDKKKREEKGVHMTEEFIPTALGGTGAEVGNNTSNERERLDA